MSRYLKTYYKDNKIARVVDGCEQCPLLKYDESTFVCRCRLFMSGENVNIVDNFAISYNPITNRINDKIPIPSWCRLPKEFNELKNNPTAYKFTGNMVNIDPRDRGSDIPIIHSLDILKEEETDKEFKILNLLSNTNDGNEDILESEEPSEYNNWEDILDFESPSEYDDWDYDIPQYHVNKNNVCSSCGNRHDTVDRNTNNGVCDECYDKLNNTYTNQIIINNFRMKRNAEFTNNEFKVIKNGC